MLFWGFLNPHNRWSQLETCMFHCRHQRGISQWWASIKNYCGGINRNLKLAGKYQLETRHLCDRKLTHWHQQAHKSNCWWASIRNHRHTGGGWASIRQHQEQHQWHSGGHQLMKQHSPHSQRVCICLKKWREREAQAREVEGQIGAPSSAPH